MQHSVFAPPPKPVRDLSADEVKTYITDGVVHVSGALSPQWLELIASAIDEHITPVVKTEPKELQSMKANLWHTDDKFHHIVMNCPVSHLAQQVLVTQASDPSGSSKPIRFFYDQTFVKHPDQHNGERKVDGAGALGNTPWHHDITFWPVRGEEIVSVWIAVDKTNLENGGLEFVPGSQHDGREYKAIGVGGSEDRLPFSSDKLDDLPRIISATSGETTGDLRAVSFDMEAGDCLIFNTKILHGAPPNSTGRARRGVALRYFGSDVVMDDLKHGERTVMAPLNIYDESLSNGDKAASHVYPQVLPTKIRSEVERRLQGTITPSKGLFKAWIARKVAADDAHGGVGPSRGRL